jgi:hypothetical protein
VLGLNGLPRRKPSSGPCPHLEVIACLQRLRGCYWDDTNDFGWPSGELLCRLHKNVNELAKRRLKRPLDDPWKAYLCVHKHFPCLHLLRVLRNVVSRSLERLRAEVRVIPERNLFYRIRKIAAYTGAYGQLARDLLTKLRGLNAGTINCKDVDWRRFEQLLKDPGKNFVELAIGNHPASRSVLCYARALEALLEFKRVFQHADSRPLIVWLRESAARELQKEGRDLVADLLAYHFLEHTDGRALARNIRASRKRKRASVDSRRYRAKKRAGLTVKTS